MLHLYFLRMKQMLGNIEEIRDLHKHSILPGLEEAEKDSNLIRYYSSKQQSQHNMKLEFNKTLKWKPDF